ncbi:type 1 fimbrial protein [Enterobacter hormaechei]|nr:type 1 fimbrial protein [Enterobacter hormaechei]
MSYRKMNIYYLLVCIGLLLFHRHVSANTKDHTRVFLDGNILDTPCSIDPGSRDQTIRMGATPVSVIAQDGAGHMVPFTIQLKDCDLARVNRQLPDWQGVRVIFNGISDGQDFLVHGTAKGVALRIFDAKGHVAVPGIPLPSLPLIAGDQALSFRMQLVSDRKPIVKGEYHAIIQFGLSYF